MASFTRKAIMAAFVTLLNEKPLDKITIKDIVEELSLIHISHAQIVAGRDAQSQRNAQRIRAVLFDHFQRIDAVAQGLTHLAALRVAHKAVDRCV